MTPSLPQSRLSRPAGIGRRAVLSAALVGAGLIATAPVVMASTTTVHSDRVTVYQGGTAAISLTGPSGDLCAIFINGGIAEWGSLGTWPGHLSWSQVASKASNGGSADNTVDFRCYDQLVSAPDIPDPSASAAESPSAAPSETPLAGPVTYSDAYDSGVTIIYKAGNTTPPPTGTDPSQSNSGSTVVPLGFAALLALLAAVSMRRLAVTRR